jgi:hypothetical protein
MAGKSTAQPVLILYVHDIKSVFKEIHRQMPWFICKINYFYFKSVIALARLMLKTTEYHRVPPSTTE